MLVTEQFSEAQHDKKLMEAQILKLSAEYNRIIQKGDIEAMGKVLADDSLKIRNFKF